MYSIIEIRNKIILVEKHTLVKKFEMLSWQRTEISTKMTNTKTDLNGQS